MHALTQVYYSSKYLIIEIQDNYLFLKNVHGKISWEKLQFIICIYIVTIIIIYQVTWYF